MATQTLCDGCGREIDQSVPTWSGRIPFNNKMREISVSITETAEDNVYRVIKDDICTLCLFGLLWKIAPKGYHGDAIKA